MFHIDLTETLDIGQEIERALVGVAGAYGSGCLNYSSSLVAPPRERRGGTGPHANDWRVDYTRW